MNRTALFLSFMILLSCKETTGPNTQPESGALMPLKVGNTWIGRATFYDTSGTVTTLANDSVTITEGDTVPSHLEWWQANHGRMYFAERSGFLSKRVPDECGIGYRIAKYPAQNNDAFPTDCDQVYCRLNSKTRVVTVPAGTFTVYDFWIETSGDGVRPRIEIRSYAPNTGLVQVQRTYATSNGTPLGWYTWELVNYSLQ
ncbi:MAG: hypothetical protein A2X67_13725 [Ignavibacteria bacterium GWA2_55_11]|nr:MAG: hypothetical protein A2X67_13725 [Ignavibacteria bacterium GWA2_55_11]OGU44532.1 MAG: hypothetical protein A2X68_11940 [Ignavibacteria bacterium GWC2_56_12]OGU69655.1 MAG: hypothetical protein A3H45_02485 [Ignavibacteria bacterium RIFCSPLOWO2_02_FULL_55_14]HAV23933.1 hypothetical protein [Bacteroidota bacterium]